MYKFFIIAAILAGCATSKYDRALRTCTVKCHPQIAVRVEYNYNNNRFDKCVCATEFEASRR